MHVYATFRPHKSCCIRFLHPCLLQWVFSQKNTAIYPSPSKGHLTQPDAPKAQLNSQSLTLSPTMHTLAVAGTPASTMHSRQIVRCLDSQVFVRPPAIAEVPIEKPPNMALQVRMGTSTATEASSSSMMLNVRVEGANCGGKTLPHEMRLWPRNDGGPDKISQMSRTFGAQTHPVRCSAELTWWSQTHALHPIREPKTSISNIWFQNDKWKHLTLAVWLPVWPFHKYTGHLPGIGLAFPSGRTTSGFATSIGTLGGEAGWHSASQHQGLKELSPHFSGCCGHYTERKE